jgi:TonB family protein
MTLLKHFRRRIAAVALPVVAIASGPAASGATLPAGQAPAVAGFHLDVEEASADLVAGLYRDHLSDWLAIQWNGDPKGLAKLLADPERFRFMRFRTEAEITRPGLEGDWEFLPPTGGERWPTSAIRTIDRSTEARFDVERIVYCAGVASDCKAATDLADARAVPRPAFAADAPSTTQWQRFVFNRPCTPGAAAMPAPPYPPTARRLAQGGKVVVNVIVDPCGQVHEAWLAESSGVSEMDRVTVQAAMKWRVPATSLEPGEGAILRIPVSFDPGTDPSRRDAAPR